MPNRLNFWVGNINNLEQRDLKKFFGQYGEVEEARIKPATANKNAFAFVTVDILQKVLDALEVDIDPTNAVSRLLEDMNTCDMFGSQHLNVQLQKSPDPAQTRNAGGGGNNVLRPRVVNRQNNRTRNRSDSRKRSPQRRGRDSKRGNKRSDSDLSSRESEDSRRRKDSDDSRRRKKSKRRNNKDQSDEESSDIRKPKHTRKRRDDKSRSPGPIRTSGQRKRDNSKDQSPKNNRRSNRKRSVNKSESEELSESDVDLPTHRGRKAPNPRSRSRSKARENTKKKSVLRSRSRSKGRSRSGRRNREEVQKKRRSSDNKSAERRGSKRSTSRVRERSLKPNRLGEYKILVDNIPDDFTWMLLKDLANDYLDHNGHPRDGYTGKRDGDAGPCSYSKVFYTGNHGNKSTIGIVEFKKQGPAKNCIERLSGWEFCGKNLTAKDASYLDRGIPAGYIEKSLRQTGGVYMM